MVAEPGSAPQSLNDVGQGKAVLWGPPKLIEPSGEMVLETGVPDVRQSNDAGADTGIQSA